MQRAINNALYPRYVPGVGGRDFNLLIHYTRQLGGDNFKQYPQKGLESQKQNYPNLESYENCHKLVGWVVINHGHLW